MKVERAYWKMSFSDHQGEARGVATKRPRSSGQHGKKKKKNQAANTAMTSMLEVIFAARSPAVSLETSGAGAIGSQIIGPRLAMPTPSTTPGQSSVAPKTQIFSAQTVEV